MYHKKKSNEVMITKDDEICIKCRIFENKDIDKNHENSDIFWKI